MKSYRPAFFDLFARETFARYHYNELLQDIETELCNAISAFIKYRSYGLIKNLIQIEEELINKDHEIKDSQIFSKTWIIDLQTFLEKAETRLVNPIVKDIKYDSLKNITKITIIGKLFADETHVMFNIEK